MWTAAGAARAGSTGAWRATERGDKTHTAPVMMGSARRELRSNMGKPDFSTEEAKGIGWAFFSSLPATSPAQSSLDPPRRCWRSQPLPPQLMAMFCISWRTWSGCYGCRFDHICIRYNALRFLRPLGDLLISISSVIEAPALVPLIPTRSVVQGRRVQCQCCAGE